MKRIALALLLFAFIPLAGCPSQNTTAALVTILGNAASSIASLQGNTSLAAKLREDTEAASTAVLNWKQGTPTQNAVQALRLVESDLSLICPTSSASCAKYAPLISLSLSTAESIIQILEPPTVKTMAKTGQYPPKTAAEFKARWDSLAPPEAQLK